jgi:hypothetical protein
MKKAARLLFCVGLMAAAQAGCNRTRDPVSISGIKVVSAEHRGLVKTDEKGHTIEQRNIMERLKTDNTPGAIKHLYVISAFSGQVLLYSPVRGKVTSSGKRLSPAQIGDPVNESAPTQTVDIGGAIATRRTNYLAMTARTDRQLSISTGLIQTGSTISITWAGAKSSTFPISLLLSRALSSTWIPRPSDPGRCCWAPVDDCDSAQCKPARHVFASHDWLGTFFLRSFIQSSDFLYRDFKQIGHASYRRDSVSGALRAGRRFQCRKPPYARVVLCRSPQGIVIRQPLSPSARMSWGVAQKLAVGQGGVWCEFFMACTATGGAMRPYDPPVIVDAIPR